MKRKTGILIALGLLLLLGAGYGIYRQNLGNDDKKQISIVMKAENEVFYEKSVSTTAATLSELLNEMKENHEILMEYENSEYGMFITALGTDKLYRQDPTSALYWTYSSENNQQCTSKGFCDAADTLVLGDGDRFEFVYEKLQ